MNVLKQKYNKLIERNTKAEKYLNDPNMSIRDIEKWMPTFDLIVLEISITQREIQNELGRKMTYKEIWNGFKEV